MTTDTIGGVWTYTLELCAALARHGVQVMLAKLGAHLRPDQTRALASLDNVVPRLSRYRLEWMADPWKDIGAAGTWLLGLEQEYAPDVIHLNHLAHGDLSWRAPVVVVGHSCVFSWWHAVHGCEPPHTWARYRQTVTNSLRAADCVVTPTSTMRSALERWYGPLPPSQVIFNARSPNVFQAEPKEAFILSAGRLWDRAKNAESLRTIAPSVEWPIWLAGSDISPDECETTPDGLRAPTDPQGLLAKGHLAARQGLHRLGPVSPSLLADLYARAALYVLPARYEPFGLTALEAAHSGCALVLGDIPSLREVWAEAACFVRPDDHAALLEALRQLIRNPARRNDLAARAQVRARRFPTETFAAAYLSIYQELSSCSSYSSTTRSFPTGTTATLTSSVASPRS